MAVPTLDSPLATWSTNFQSLGTAAPLDFNLTAPIMVQYTTMHDLYIAAYNAARADGSRSKALVTAKNDAKAPLIAYARELYGIIQTSPNVTDENKVLIGVTVKSNIPTPMPPPALSHLVSIVSVTGREVRGTLKDRQFPESRRRPPNAEGCTLLTYSGATPPPANDPGWRLAGQTGKTQFVVQFPNDVAAGTACWITAMWYNRRGEYSPAAPAVLTYLQIGSMQQAA